MVVINEEIIRNSETEELMKIFKIDLDEAILLKNILLWSLNLHL